MKTGPGGGGIDTFFLQSCAHGAVLQECARSIARPTSTGPGSSRPASRFRAAWARVRAARRPSPGPGSRSSSTRTWNSKGRYLLLGSAGFSLHKQPSESSSGRTGLLDLSPFPLQKAISSLGADRACWIKLGRDSSPMSDRVTALGIHR